MKTNKTNFAKIYLHNPTKLRSLALGVTLLSAMLSFPAQAVPSFARQTGFDCAQCHTVSAINTAGQAIQIRRLHYE